MIPQGGGIVFRRDERGLAILLVESKKTRGLWGFPKGHVEDDESLDETALRETWEEAGVHGELLGPVGAPLEFRSGWEDVSVQYFLIRAVSEVPDTDGRAKAWMTYEQALQKISHEEARQLLREAMAAIDRL